MRITLITGDAPRHQYLFRQLNELGIDIQWFVEKRDSPANKFKINDKKIQYLSKIHFKDWTESEISYFNVTGLNLFIKGTPNFITSKSTQNGYYCKEIEKWNPDVILSYGCSKISSDILDIPGIKKLNIHGGLSPWYRGTITNFWPTYLLEPQFTGMTLHETTNEIDGGKILLQTSIDVDANFGVNQNSCQAILNFVKVFTATIYRNFDQLITAQGLVQSSSGRIWTNSMWTPYHLIFVYEFMNNQVNRYCIENQLLQKRPKLINELLF